MTNFFPSPSSPIFYFYKLRVRSYRCTRRAEYVQNFSFIHLIRTDFIHSIHTTWQNSHLSLPLSPSLSPSLTPSLPLSLSLTHTLTLSPNHSSNPSCRPAPHFRQLKNTLLLCALQGPHPTLRCDLQWKSLMTTRSLLSCSQEKVSFFISTTSAGGKIKYPFPPPSKIGLY